MKAAYAFQSTRPSRGATMLLCPYRREASISIHAPLAGRDREARACGYMILRISIHAPLAGRDTVCFPGNMGHPHFNPRAPRGARRFQLIDGRVAEYFNPRAPRGARRADTGDTPSAWAFQSTRPSRGATPFFRRLSQAFSFQSTRPSRGATANVHKNHVHICTNTQKKYVFLSNTVCQSA